MLENLKKLYHFSNTWTGTVVIVLLAIFFLAQAFVIPSGSMKRTYLIGDFLLVKKFSYGVPIPHIPLLEIPVMPDIFGNGHLIEGDRPQRGDITVFRYPHNPDLHYVKRCVAVGGDMVMVRNKNLFLRPHEGDEYIKATYLPDLIVEIEGALWVQNPYLYTHPGVTHDENVQASYTIFPSEYFDFGPEKISADHFFMMGDNREHSNDSRAWGSVPYKYIVGTPWITYLSWENRGYDEVLNGGNHSASDHVDLKKACGDLMLTSPECMERWNKEMYRIRWDRMFKTPVGLEELIR
jgi:signal peptidase I